MSVDTPPRAQTISHTDILDRLYEAEVLDKVTVTATVSGTGQPILVLVSDEWLYLARATAALAELIGNGAAAEAARLVAVGHYQHGRYAIGLPDWTIT